MTLPAKLGATLPTNEWKSAFPSKPIRLEHWASTARVEVADGEVQIMWRLLKLGISQPARTMCDVYHISSR